MSRKSSFDNSDKSDNQSVYVYGSDSDGFTKVTYGTSAGTSYEYFPPTVKVRPDENSVPLDPNRPMFVDEDMEY